MANKSSSELQFGELFQRLPADEQKKLLAHIMTMIKRYQTRRVESGSLTSNHSS